MGLRGEVIHVAKPSVGSDEKSSRSEDSRKQQRLESVIDGAMRQSKVHFSRTAKGYAEMWPKNANMIHPSIFIVLEQQGLFNVRNACFTIEGD